MNRTMLTVAGVFSASSLLLVDSAIKATALLMLAAVAAVILRRDSAATRHLVWLLAIVAMLAVPVLSAMLPQWRVLPEWATIPPQPVVVDKSPPSIARRADGDFDLPQNAEPVEVERPSVSAYQPAAAPPGSRPALATPETIPASTVRSWNWLNALPLVWAIGFCVLILRLMAARWMLWNIERQGTAIWSSAVRHVSQRASVDEEMVGTLETCPTPHDTIVTALEAAFLQLGIGRPVTLLIHPDETIPVVWGILRCRLLLPAAARKWSGEQLRSVLLHELAHIKRRDTIAQLLAQMACALHWFNPLVWFAAWRLGVERERACDDLVLASGVQPSAYAGHLLEVVTKLAPARWTQSCGLAMARKSSLEGRLVAVLSGNLNRRGVSVALAGIALAIAVVIAVPIAMLCAADETPGAPLQQQKPVQQKPVAQQESQKPKDSAKLDRSTLEGVWMGEKDDIKVEAKFIWYSEHQQVQWEVKTNGGSNIGAQMSVVMEPDGSGAKFVFRKGLKFEAIQGRVMPGEGGTLRLEMIPNPHIIDPGYPAVKDLVLKRWIGRHARLLPKSEAARPLFKKWREHARADGTIPGTLLEQLGVSVKQFLKNNPGQKWPHELHVKLAPLITMIDLPPEDAIFLLDEVAGISTTPIQMILDGAVEGAIQPEGPQKPNAGAKLPGRLFVNAGLRTTKDDRRFSQSAIAIDPNTGSWMRLQNFNESGFTVPLSPVRVSPNGRTMLFMRENEIWKCDAMTGENPARVFPRGQPKVWAPDGKEFVVVVEKEAGRSDRTENWRVSADGKNQSLLALPIGEVVEDWSADGRWLLGWSHADGQLSIVKPDGSGRSRLTNTNRNASRNEHPRFSPDGRRIVYLQTLYRGDGDAPGSRFSLRTINIDGTDDREILGETAVEPAPAKPAWTAPMGARWSPDGTHLAVVLFDHTRDGGILAINGNWRLAIIDADGGNLRELKLEGVLNTVLPWDGPEWRPQPTAAVTREPKQGAKLQPATEQKLKWGEPANGLRMALAWPPAFGEPGMSAWAECKNLPVR